MESPRRKEERPPFLEEVFQPWELAGEARRDCEPHRAGLLAALARISLLAGGLSFVCPPASLVGLPLGLVTRAMARRDLDLIFAGGMDHRGYRRTEKARSASHAGVILSLLGPLLWLLLWLVPFAILCLLSPR